jgi:putative ABC transport system permease protein
VFILLGVGAIGAVVGGADGALLGVAVVAIFVGVLLLGPVMANPIATVLGAPVQRLRGVTGAMARSNVQRNPKRTARTAAPVLIGVALVTGATVFASSIKTQLRETIGSVFIGEYVINSSNGGALSFSQEFVDRLNELPEVGDATGLGFAQLRYTGRDSVAFSTTADPATATGLLDYDFIEGSFAELTPDGVLVSTGEAQREEIGIGSRLEFDVGDEVRTLTVQGIYRSDELAQARVVTAICWRTVLCRTRPRSCS